jgi:predicted alpha-1,6-mannanase (GH76 family)
MTVRQTPEKVCCKIESKSAMARLKTICLSVPFLALFFGALPASAFTAADADTIMDSYNKAFFELSASGGYYKETETRGITTLWTGGITTFWRQAEEIEGMLDAYERTWSPEYKSKVEQLLQGFIETNQRDWSQSISNGNDDILWACIAFSRAYLDTGISSFKQMAQNNFDVVYARAWDDKLGGGMWWNTKKITKNACVNGPGAIAAYLLYLSTGDPDYLTKATNIYNWERAHLFDPSNGQVYDLINGEGLVDPWSSTYNQGTFVGAANYLGNVQDATLATDYTMNKMGSADSGKYRIMPAYAINDNNSGFNSIGIRWFAKFMKDHNRQGSYLPWLQANANAAWNMRRPGDNLSWCQWEKQTPDNLDLHSWDCMSSAVALQVVPPDQVVSSEQPTLANQAPPSEPPASTNQDAPVNSDTK